MLKEYVEGKEITERQIGSVPVIMKCLPRWPRT